MLDALFNGNFFSASIEQPILSQLRATAHLYGVDAVELNKARILSLGISHNPLLATCALSYPDSQIIDLAIGQPYLDVSQLSSLRNYNAVSVSWDQITPELGSFDFIICPDLLAYLPTEVAQDLLNRCKALLEPGGLACVGYPTFPGAKSLEIVRDALLLHLRDHLGSHEDDQKAQALTALSLFDNFDSSADSLGLSLQVAAEYFRRKIERGYLPIIMGSPDALGRYHVEFAQAANQAGLACIGDGHPHLGMAKNWGISINTSNSLLTLGQSDIIRQQYLDFSTARLWRHTLLTHVEREINPCASPEISKLADLRWAGCWEPMDWAPVYEGQIYQNNQGRQQKIKNEDSAHILDMLAASWPSSLSVKDLQTLCQLSSDAVLSIISEQFDAGALNYCMDGDADPSSNPEGVFPLPELISELHASRGSEGDDQVKQFHADILDSWGNPVHLSLAFLEILLLNRVNFDQSHEDVDDIARIDKENDFSDLIVSDSSIAYELLRKLNKLALLSRRTDCWLILLDRILSDKDGADGCWVMYLLHMYIHGSLRGQLNHERKIKVSSGQYKQLADLESMFVAADHAKAELLAKQLCKKLPELARPLSILIRCLAYQGKYDEALSIAFRSRDRVSSDPDLYPSIVLVIAVKGNAIEALRISRPILYKERSPDYLYNALGVACRHALMIEAAERYFKDGLEKDSESVSLIVNLASLYSQLGKAKEGIAICQGIIGNKRLAREAKILAYNNLLFMVNYAHDMSADQIFKIYQNFENEFFRKIYAYQRPHGNKQDTGRKIRIGYVSPDFKDHAVAKFINPLYKYHDRDRFVIYSYSNVSIEDGHTGIFRSLSDHWRNIYNLKDNQVADMVRNDEIDILVDLAGHTAGNRLGVFALKPAPVSVSWLGFGYTTGLSAIDYYLANEVLCPQGFEALFAEKVWKLKGTWATYRPGIPNEFLQDQREDQIAQVSNKIITFISLSRVIRMNDRVIRCWASILSQVPGSRLVLNSMDFGSAGVCDDIRLRFLGFGISSDRIYMGFATPPWPSLAKADIGLDCFPHNSGTTLFDMLYMGVPFITLADRPSVGRIGASVLTSVGHPEWVADTEEKYIEKAVSLADKIMADKFFNKAGLIDEVNSSDLADTQGFVGRVEGAYTQMFAGWAGRG
ncbi:hypothetical protein [Castellaniella sp. MT123]|uniref:O-linked N-acetylglucosamine transferase family protein n=1 Tax=Castellaniella sp. MT123 TaxID=3140381 RepID=UPI0031F3F763